MAARLRTLGRQALTRIDAWYQRKFNLQSLGPVLLVGCEPYRGRPREFPDGTRLLADQRIGVLHFNNAQIAAQISSAGEGRQRAGVRFARLFRESLHDLALHAQSDPWLQDVTVYHGLTWFKAHGGKVGFVSEAFPVGLKRWWLSTYFHILTWGFSPVVKSHAAAHEPRWFWITRNDLIKHFGASAAHESSQSTVQSTVTAD